MNSAQGRPLGASQEMALDCLEKRGPFPGGWMLENTSGTIRVLESLVRRGLVEAYQGIPLHSRHPTTCYRLKAAPEGNDQ